VGSAVALAHVRQRPSELAAVEVGMMLLLLLLRAAASAKGNLCGILLGDRSIGQAAKLDLDHCVHYEPRLFDKAGYQGLNVLRLAFRPARTAWDWRAVSALSAVMRDSRMRTHSFSRNLPVPAFSASAISTR
jgi:hypothetical protein